MSVMPRNIVFAQHSVRPRCAAIVNHSAIVNSLCVANLLRVVFLVRQGPLGSLQKKIGNGPNTVSRSTVSNTELSEFVWAH